jgi:hypothetical protein
MSAPERIWADPTPDDPFNPAIDDWDFGTWSEDGFSAGASVQYVRVDLHDTLRAERDAAQAAAQKMQANAFAATNPANWQTGDTSDAARLAHFEKTLDEIAEAVDYDVLERTLDWFMKHTAEPLRAERDALAARVERLEGALREIADDDPDDCSPAFYYINFASAALSTDAQ